LRRRVCSHAFEHRHPVVERVSKHVGGRFAPRNQAAVVPNQAIFVVHRCLPRWTCAGQCICRFSWNKLRVCERTVLEIRIMDRLHAMRVFLRVAERASFTQAAKSLELSRARISEAIAELERELGVLLLHRTTRQVSLTDDGRLYYDRARQILADVEEADALVQRGSAQARGRLRLAMPMAIARRFVVPALPGLLAKHPELGLEIRLENRAVDLLEAGIDAAISYGEPADQDLVARRLGETHLLTCASPTYLARRGTPRTPHDIEYHECIAFLTLATLRPAEWAFVIK